MSRLCFVGFIIYVEQDAQTDWFNSAAVSSDKDFDGVSISKDAADIVVASFRSGKILFAACL